jgi:transposase
VGLPAILKDAWGGGWKHVYQVNSVSELIRAYDQTGQLCMVADRGMISAENIKELEQRGISYIFGARMRTLKVIKEDVLSSPGQYRDVRPEGSSSKDPAPLKVKVVVLQGKRYIVCLNPRQARKDAQDREAIVDSLKDKIKTGPKSLIGNKGYRKYLKIERQSVSIDQDKIEYESRFDGKWVLITNTSLSAEEVALKYKELWQVEHVFRDVKSVLETRPVYHQRDENIRDLHRLLGQICMKWPDVRFISSKELADVLKNDADGAV